MNAGIWGSTPIEVSGNWMSVETRLSITVAHLSSISILRAMDAHFYDGRSAVVVLAPCRSLFSQTSLHIYHT